MEDMLQLLNKLLEAQADKNTEYHNDTSTVELLLLHKPYRKLEFLHPSGRQPLSILNIGAYCLYL